MFWSRVQRLKNVPPQSLNALKTRLSFTLLGLFCSYHNSQYPVTKQSSVLLPSCADSHCYCISNEHSMRRPWFLRHSRRTHEGLASSMPSHEAWLDLHLFYSAGWQRGGTTSWEEWVLTYSACARVCACMSMLGHSLWGELGVNHSAAMRGVTGQFIATLRVLSCTFKRDLYSYNAKPAERSRPAHLLRPLGHEVTALP